MTVALVLGGAACVWDDVEAALYLGEFDGVIGANHIGIVWPGVMDGWVSLHGTSYPALGPPAAASLGFPTTSASSPTPATSITASPDRPSRAPPVSSP
jgi:hypothetical protein